MPGTILVSVLEFMGLPLSSSTSLTVSMGKTAYQISDKGDFSFPLTSLRIDLIVLLQEVDGNEIWRTGIEAKSIVEKGVWEELFSVGRGRLHLKLQFILNDEEREKIRMMRQSALKKKHEELLNSSLRSAESATTSDRSAAIPFCTNDEVSDLPKRYQLEAASVKEKNSPVHNHEKPGFGNVVGAESYQKQLNPNIADQNREIPSTSSVSQADDLTQLQQKVLIKKPAFHSPSMEDLQRAIGSKGRSVSVGRSEQNIACMDNLIHPEKQNPLGKTPSNVRKMISAFESGIIQDTRSHIKPPPTNCQFSEIETNASSTNWHSEDYKAQDTELACFLNGRIRGASHAGELQQAPVYIRESGIACKGSHESCIQGDSPRKLDSVLHFFEDKFYSVESSGAWIFPDDRRKFCVQTGGKILMDLLECQDKRRINHQRSLDFSITEVADKNPTSSGTGTEVRNHGKIHKIEESKSKISDDNDDKNSAGPVEQVIKAAIIVGFGILVLLTRQRKNR